MLFNSGEYLLFFVLTLLLTWCLVGFPRLRLWVLLIASYYFYTVNNHWLIVLILISTQIDYFCGWCIAYASQERRRKFFLWLSIASNLGILGLFKYFNFFADSFTQLANLFGAQLSWVDLNIALPVGISFYTFQSMSYTIDVYRREIPHEPSWCRFSFYVAFFPQLIAGPIVRARDFLPQLGHRPQLDAAALEMALFRIMRGLLKKIVLADFLGYYADLAFNTPQQVSFAGAWLGVYAFTFQIYFDFSGYSDIAIGCSRLLGYHLPENFRRPYMAVSMSDFWRRWHISLSSWLRDYLYISLGGNRMKRRTGIYRNIMLTMLLGGLWHGAAINFVLWGAFHGLLLVGERILGLRHTPQYDTENQKPLLLLLQPGHLLHRFLLFNFIAFTWLLFRSENVKILGELFYTLSHPTGTITITLGMALAWLLIFLGWCAQFLAEYVNIDGYILRWPTLLRGLAYAAAFFFICMFNAAGPTPFIYFQF